MPRVNPAAGFSDSKHMYGKQTETAIAAVGYLAEIWQGGCIIRAKVLHLVQAAFAKDPSLPNLLLDEAVAAEMRARLPGWRRFVLLAMRHGVPVPALSASNNTKAPPTPVPAKPSNTWIRNPSSTTRKAPPTSTSTTTAPKQ